MISSSHSFTRGHSQRMDKTIGEWLQSNVGEEIRWGERELEWQLIHHCPISCGANQHSTCKANYLNGVTQNLLELYSGSFANTLVAYVNILATKDRDDNGRLFQEAYKTCVKLINRNVESLNKIHKDYATWVKDLTEKISAERASGAVGNFDAILFFIKLFEKLHLYRKNGREEFEINGDIYHLRLEIPILCKKINQIRRKIYNR